MPITVKKMMQNYGINAALNMYDKLFKWTGL